MQSSRAHATRVQCRGHDGGAAPPPPAAVPAAELQLLLEQRRRQEELRSRQNPGLQAAAEAAAVEMPHGSPGPSPDPIWVDNGEDEVEVPVLVQGEKRSTLHLLPAMH